MEQAALAQTARWRPVLFTRATLFLCLVGVALPSALSIGALFAGIGTPPRTSAIVLYATIAIVARIVPRWIVVPLYLGVVVYDAISTIALLFNLDATEIGLALQFGANLHVFESPLYVALIVASVSIAALNIYLLVGWRDLLRRGNPLVLMGFALAFAAADLAANTSPHYHYGTLFAAGKPMESGALESGFAAAVKDADRNVLVVVVEAMGQFADPRMQDILLSPLRDPKMLADYTVKNGSTTYYGSTTAAELRELCSTRVSYQEVLGGADVHCLPQELAARGYSTTSLHNFSGEFFDREHWYPKIGIERHLFGDQLVRKDTHFCGGPFRGPCDKDLVPFVSAELQGSKKFVYWLTLSTHVPIALHEGTPRLNCERGGGPIGHAEVCYMTELWMDVLAGVATIAREHPGTEILVVGDHAPPLWSKAGRRLFAPGKATWIRLVPKAGQS